MLSLVAYYRDCGAGGTDPSIDEQRRAVYRFAARNHCRIVAEFEESTPSGKHARQPQLTAALREARKREAGCGVVTARLDHFCEDAASLSSLIKGGTPVLVVDSSSGDEAFLLISYRAYISAEREAKERKAELRVRNPRFLEANEAINARRAAEAHAFAAAVAPVIEEVMAAGARSLRDIAAALSLKGVPTAKGGRWQAQQVADVLRRIRGKQHSPGADRPAGG